MSDAEEVSSKPEASSEAEPIAERKPDDGTKAGVKAAPRPRFNPPRSALPHGWNLDHVTKLAGAAAIGLYVLGLLIVNTYLFGLGVSDFSVLRTRFVLTGLLALLPPLALLFLALLAASVVTDFGELWDRDEKPKQFQTRSMLILRAILLATLPLALISQFDEYGIGPNLILPDRILLLMAPIFVMAMVLSMSPIFDNDDMNKMSGFQFSVMVLGSVMFAGIFGIGYLDGFANDVYPKVPEQFGGGKPKTVQLLFASGSEPLAEKLGLAPAEPVSLLWETENVYVVREAGNDDAPVLQIDRDAVSAVLLLPDGSEAMGSPTASPVASATRANLTQAEDFIDRLIARAATVEAMSFAERRAILGEFGVSATVFPAGSEVRYAIDMVFNLEPWDADAASGRGDGSSGFELPTV